MASRAAELAARIRHETPSPVDDPIPTARVLDEALSRYRSPFGAEFGGLNRLASSPGRYRCRCCCEAGSARGRELPGHRARHNSYLDGHAFLIDGLLDLYETTGEIGWEERAPDLQ